MGRQLKVYGGCYDGRNRVIVAAATKRAAYEAVKAALGSISYYGWDEYTSETWNDREVEFATSAPGTVFSAKNDRFHDFSPLPQHSQGENRWQG